MYLLQNVDKPDTYWAGDCKFAKLEIQNNLYKGPVYNNYPIIGDSIQWYGPPNVPFSFGSSLLAKEAIEFVPRTFNVRVVEVRVDFEIKAIEI